MGEPRSELLFWEKTKDGRQATKAPAWIAFLLDLRCIKTPAVISSNWFVLRRLVRVLFVPSYDKV